MILGTETNKQIRTAKAKMSFVSFNYEEQAACAACFSFQQVTSKLVIDKKWKMIYNLFKAQLWVLHEVKTFNNNTNS